MTTPVELPVGDLIGYLDFARALARAISPVVEDGATGLACITGKLVRYAILPQALDLGSRQADQPPSETSTASTPAVSQLQLPYKLTPDDLRHLENLLPQLPTLCHPLSEDIRSGFMDAYRKVGETDWEPTLLTELDIEAQRQRQEQAYAQFRQVLQDEFSNGRLAVCDAHHIPVRALGPGSFVPRQSAIGHLTRYGLAYVSGASCVTKGAAATANGERLPAEHQTPGSLLDSQRQPEARPRTPDEIVRFRLDLKLRGVKAFAKLTAEEFGVSDSYVRAVVRKFGSASPFPVPPKTK